MSPETNDPDVITEKQLAAMIAVGQADADRGELVDSEDVFEELRRKSDARRVQTG